MRSIFEYWAVVERPGYEIIGASPWQGREGGTVKPRPPQQIEPMLSLRAGYSVNLLYDADYIPLSEYPGLFMLFAQMERDQDMVLAFAHMFGRLGLLEIVALPTVQREHVVAERVDWLDKLDTFEGRYLCFAEPLRRWYEEMDHLRDAVMLWDRFRDEPTNTIVAKELRSRVRERLSNVNPTLHFEEARPQLCVSITPSTLSEALWLQLALAIDGRKDFKRCPTCGQWFEIGKYGTRRDKKYCSGACKQKAYDKRRTAKPTP